MGYYKSHVFMCVNEREEGKRCCHASGADELQQYAKQKIRELKLDGSQGIRINRAGCLGRCKLGPVLVVYPDNVWYHYETQADIDEIIESHLVGGVVVERLRLQE
ncbi:MAG: 2Fe-2S ferredoxin [Gammaproteobacteria bacterium CG11_big_fil_rev_8_21_14_0_20_46_22]|nr:MAG: 2Fe-2S ferredoxin [Gammaproteobacteria bacterium CG12_big_fil_rev_8_21_14_0_65_46_12]PIR11110.1 MAG: 2Fe-2S ferredoxin [Gammaproteobacteria bacterium CG11_big_fil_rev_8_21_14_0_20_46_22]